MLTWNLNFQIQIVQSKSWYNDVLLSVVDLKSIIMTVMCHIKSDKHNVCFVQHIYDS